MAALTFTEIAVCGQTIHLFDMPDRRPGASSSRPTRWAFQMQIEEDEETSILLKYFSSFT